MKKQQLWLACTMALGLSFSANAQAQTAFPIEPRPFNFQYTYADISFVDMADDQNGLAANGSYRLQDNLNVIGGMISTASNDRDYNSLHLGVAYNAALPGTKLKLDYMSHAGLEYRNKKHNVGTASISDQDISLRIGTMLQLTLQPRLETYVDLVFTMIGGGDLSLKGGLLYHVSGRLSLQASYDLGDKQQLNVGVRVTQR